MCKQHLTSSAGRRWAGSVAASLVQWVSLQWALSLSCLHCSSCLGHEPEASAFSVTGQSLDVFLSEGSGH